MSNSTRILIAVLIYYSMESDLMRRTAATLAEGAKTDFQRLLRIHDHVTSSVRYVRDGDWDPAETVLTRGTGSCSEYNYVLSGLCRLAGLPTRCVGGSHYAMPFQFSRVPKRSARR